MPAFLRVTIVASISACVPGGPGATLSAQMPGAPVVLQTSESQRRQYLATATIWRPGGVLTPDQIREGPPGQVFRGVDAWVAAFLHKVEEIGHHSCPS